MPSDADPKNARVRGQIAKAHSGSANPDLTAVVDQTVKLWRKYHLDYDQTKYVVEQVRRTLPLSPPKTRRRTIERLDRAEIESLLQAGYRLQSKYGLIIKTLFYTGARVEEFISIRIEDLFLHDSPAQIHITQAKRQSTRYVPLLRSLAQELQTHLNGRKTGYLFESNRHDRYSARAIQDIVKEAAKAAGITKRVYPHLLRHSIATILLQSGEVPLDPVQKFLGHLQIGTTQIYAETSLSALGENYQRALGTPP
jgi:integrase/recombinase XerD